MSEAVRKSREVRGSRPKREQGAEMSQLIGDTRTWMNICYIHVVNRQSKMALVHSLLSSDSFKILALHRLTFRLYLTDSCAGSMGRPNFHRIWWRYQLVSFLC